MSEFKLPCNCTWSAGCGPNLLCPVHGSSHHLAATLTETRAENQRLRILMDTAKVVEREHAFLDRIALLEAAIRKHRDRIWEDKLPPDGHFDQQLYAVLQEVGNEK